jgi:hypothetical protein
MMGSVLFTSWPRGVLLWFFAILDHVKERRRFSGVRVYDTHFWVYDTRRGIVRTIQGNGGTIRRKGIRHRFPGKRRRFRFHLSRHHCMISLAKLGSSCRDPAI